MAYDEKICCICGKKFIGYGNNPWPIKEEGVCCDQCDVEQVLGARILMSYSKKQPEKDKAE